MDFTEIKFTKDKLAMNATVSELMMNDLKLITGKNGDDFMRDTFTMQLQGFIMTNLNERKTITVYRERPTFWEWLTRKPRSFTFEFDAKEVLKNPPQLPPGQSVIIYSVREG